MLVTKLGSLFGHFGFGLPGESWEDKNVDSPVPFGPSAPTLAFHRGPQDFGISCYDTVIEALVEL